MTNSLDPEKCGTCVFFKGGKCGCRESRFSGKNRIAGAIACEYHYLTPAAENEKYTLPCPYNKEIRCVQLPADDSCGCDDYCNQCPTKMEIKTMGKKKGNLVLNLVPREEITLTDTEGEKKVCTICLPEDRTVPVKLVFNAPLHIHIERSDAKVKTKASKRLGNR